MLHSKFHALSTLNSRDDQLSCSDPLIKKRMEFIKQQSSEENYNQREITLPIVC